jgi:hypothetical protein
VPENRMICERKPMFEDMSPYIESSVLIAYALPTAPSLFSQSTALLPERRGDTASQDTSSISTVVALFFLAVVFADRFIPPRRFHCIQSR